RLARPTQRALRRHLRRPVSRNARPDRGGRLRRLRREDAALGSAQARRRGARAAAVKVAVVGGGLAGLSAALDLVDAGHEVSLYEARPTLGGAVQTLPHREGDPEPPPDNGQHIALACFTEYVRFLDRIGEQGAVWRVPLGPMHGDAAGRALEEAGATVLIGVRVEALGELKADAIVVAVPPAESARLLGESEPQLEHSPVVSVHLLFDRPLLRSPLVALLGSPAHWVFNRSRLTGGPEGYLTVVSSGAPELEALRGRELVDLIAGAVTERLGDAELVWSRVSREPNATIAVRPGSEAHRPGPQTSKPNVVRAGAWTAT